MSGEGRQVVAFYRWTNLVPPHDFEDIMIEDLRSREDLMRTFVMPSFKLDMEGRVSVREQDEISEVFVPMSMAEYCLWNTLSVRAFASGGHFFFYADETGVLSTAKNGSMRIRVVDVFEPAVDWSALIASSQPPGEANAFRVLDSGFSLPADTIVLADVTMPLGRWVSDSLKMAQEYALTVRYALELASECVTQSPSIARVAAICARCENAIPMACAELDELFPM